MQILYYIHYRTLFLAELITGNLTLNQTAALEQTEGWSLRPIDQEPVITFPVILNKR